MQPSHLAKDADFWNHIFDGTLKYQYFGGICFYIMTKLFSLVSDIYHLEPNCFCTTLKISRQLHLT
jgi:hypothetical protein